MMKKNKSNYVRKSYNGRIVFYQKLLKCTCPRCMDPNLLYLKYIVKTSAIGHFEG